MKLGVGIGGRWKERLQKTRFDEKKEKTKKGKVKKLGVT